MDPLSERVRGQEENLFRLPRDRGGIITYTNYNTF